MKKALSTLIATLLLTPASNAGIPAAHRTENAKWMQVDPAFMVDTEDIGIRGDRIRFWVRRTAVGNEEMSTQQRTTWTGKMEIRCGDFHARGATRYRDGWSGYTYIYGPWEQMDNRHFGSTLASNFCHLVGSPGYTPEPIQHEWQRKITATIAKEPVKNSRAGIACRDKAYSPRCRFN